MTADIRAQITQKIVAALEAGTPPWRKGWTTTGGLHYNEATKRPYRGINQILLALAAHDLPPIDGKSADTADPRWLTMKQANAQGLKVRKGSKAAQIVRMVEVSAGEPTKDTDEVLAQDKKSKLVMKLFHVFHASQVEGLAPLPPKADRIEPVAAAEKIAEGMKATGVALLHGGDSASYFEKLDTVRLPDRSAFKSAEDFYGTMLHELAHATGAEKRLKRLNRDARFGSALYAKEELVAELAAAMTCAEVGIPLGPTHIANHAAYMQSWLDCLKADKNAIFVASGAAERACEFMRMHAVRARPKERAKQEIDPPQPESVAAPKRRRGMPM